MNLNTLSAYRLTQSLYSFSVINSKQEQLDSTVIRYSEVKVTTKEEIFFITYVPLIPFAGKEYPKAFHCCWIRAFDSIFLFPWKQNATLNKQ